jgi:hypothetical protein
MNPSCESVDEAAGLALKVPLAVAGRSKIIRHPKTNLSAQGLTFIVQQTVHKL